MAATVPFRAVSASEAPADIIFHGGPITTMDDRQPRAEAVAVRGSRIAFVGRREAAFKLQGPGTRVIDLDGRALLPGFFDPHMHTVFAAFDDWLDISPFTVSSMNDVLGRLRDAAGKAPEGNWLRAWQFDPSITPGARPITIDLLDEVAGDSPTFIMENNGHVAYGNSAAFRLAGITKNTPDPPQGRYERDSNGNLTGRMQENPAFRPLVEKMPSITAAEFAAGIRRMFDHAASVGCTSLFDCGIGLMSGGADLQVIQSVMAENPPIRLSGALVSTAMDEWAKLGVNPGYGDDRFRIRAIKAWADGSNQARTGFQREPYLGSTSRGSLNYSLDELTEAVRSAHERGWQVCVHANGDAAIDTTINVYREVLGENSLFDHRHRIEHCSILHPEQISAMKSLGLSPSFLIGHVHFWGRAFRDEILGPERAKLYDPCASALAAGLRISLHSDYNVTPIEPLRCIENAVTRIMRDGGEMLNPDERIPVLAAIRAVTIDAAWQCRMDHLTGSLETGKAADFVILERDPTKADPADIGKIKVHETWLDGERRFQS